MIGLTLPPLAAPLFASLKRKSGHLTRNTSGIRHLAKCAGDPPADTCCTYGAPDIPAWTPASLTLASLSGCCANANGTYLLTQDGVNKCQFGKHTDISDGYDACDTYDCVYRSFLVKLLAVGVSVTLYNASYRPGVSMRAVVTLTFGEYSDFRPGPLGCKLANFQYHTMAFEGACADRVLPFYEYVSDYGATVCTPASITLA